MAGDCDDAAKNCCPRPRRAECKTRVFGSVARGQDQLDSDLDLLADLPSAMGLLGLGQVRDEFEAIVGVRVDLVPASDLKPDVRDRVIQEAIAL